MLRLIIKGGPGVALEELSKRGIDARVHANLSSRHPETFAIVSEECFEEVGKWFLESSPIEPGYGFADGTLLHYQILKAKEEI